MVPGISRVLLVENDHYSREAISALLRSWNCRVTTAHTVAESLRLAYREQFHLYFLTNTLPDGSGLELCRRIRQFDRQTPVFFFANIHGEEIRDKAYTAGAQIYLAKPIEARILRDAVMPYLEGTSTRIKSATSPVVLPAVTTQAD